MKSDGARGEKTAAAKGQKYKIVAVGGTFDILHAGHEKLLALAFQLGSKVLIGMTSDRLVSRMRKSHPVKPFPERLRQLTLFLRSKGWNHRAKIVKLEDPLGPAVSRKRLDAIIVSSETRSNASEINRLRKRSGLRSLRVHAIRLLKAEDGRRISDTRIRKGQIDAAGGRRTKTI
ncbi:MAG TPA: pantetheine-phosphate adenylyltransferase [Candidatus Bathyarchaeia archaeon]|nr:pantetheine-phosphate adenylyltransferase [Candidatus Bathyarchaeia archaeon]